MREIVGMTKHIVAQAKNYESDTIPGDFATLTARCPKCGGEVHEKYKKFQCVDCDFGFWKIMGGRQLDPAEADTLLSTREVGPLDGFRSKIGRPFSAKLRLTDANEVEFDFGPRADDDDGAGARFLGADAARPVPEMRQPRLRNAQCVCLRARGRRGTHLRFPFGPDDPAAADRARADEEAARDRQDRSAAVRVRAHAAAVLGVPRASRRTARSASSSRRRSPAARARAADAQRAAARARHASARPAAGRVACGPLRSVRQARQRPMRRCPTATLSIRCRSMTRSRSSTKKRDAVPTRSTRRTVKTRAPRKMTPGVAERPAATAARRARATGNGAAATDVGATIRSTVKSGAATARSSVRKSAAKTLAVKKTATKTTTARRR